MPGKSRAFLFYTYSITPLYTSLHKPTYSANSRCAPVHSFVFDFKQTIMDKIFSLQTFGSVLLAFLVLYLLMKYAAPAPAATATTSTAASQSAS